MKLTTKLSIFLILVSGCSYAQDITSISGRLLKDELIKERSRAHSVREVVKNVGKLEEKKVFEVSAIQHMFEDGEVSAQVEVMYSGHDIKNNANPYTTAIGGILKYELADFKGFNAGVAFSTSQDINVLSGDGSKLNPLLSSSEGSYTELTEAYLNYSYKGLNLRAGRQVVDTPLADSDDIRIISNTFEAYIASFEFNRWTFMAGKLTNWQGTDAGLNTSWQGTGDEGTYFGGVSLSKVLLDVNAWVYDFSKDTNTNSATGNIANKTAYVDFSLHNKFAEDFFLHTNLQYLHQSESDKSNIEASVYGALVEFVAYDFGISVAYNKSENKAGKGSFSGYGGGTLFTNMDNMILDNISFDREVNVVVAGVTYTYDAFGFVYAYGNFKGKANSLGQKEHIIEQNIGLQWQVNKDTVFAALCTINDNKENTGSNAYFFNAATGNASGYGNFTNYRLSFTYNF